MLIEEVILKSAIEEHKYNQDVFDIATREYKHAKERIRLQ
jgi:hypothetical protein